MLNFCEWHPLTKYLKRVKEFYTKYVEKTNSEFSYNFNFWLNALLTYENNEEIEELLKIFSALDITTYKNLTLFKYKSGIELSELGFGSDFFYLYDGLYRECRSIVFDLRDCSVALAAIQKFKNFGEDEKDWGSKSIYNKYNHANFVTFTNKMDGSYQQYRWNKEKMEVFGSGSQALDPNCSWRLERGLKLLKENGYTPLLKLFPNCTFCFEFVSPDNPVVVKYDKKDEGLYLFAVRNVVNGMEWDYEILKQKADLFGVKCVEQYKNTDLSTILNSVDLYSSNEKEGWVISIWEDEEIPFRVKIKTTDYILMHHSLANNISPNAIIQSIMEDKIDDFKSKVPVAYIDLVEKIESEVREYLKLMYQSVEKYYKELVDNCKDLNDRKEVMLYIDNNIPSFINSYIKNKYLNRPNDFLKKGTNSHKRLGEILLLTEKIKKEGKINGD